MNTEELLVSYKEGKRNFEGADLTGADLREAYLRGADLTGAYLREAYLRGADLRGAYLRGADLREADLTGAYLARAYLTGADLREADLTGANLRGADLRGADLRGADLTGANLPTSSHDAIFEILRSRAISVLQRMIAGCVIVSRDWCWNDFARIIGQSEGQERETWEWALSILKEWECFRSCVEKLESKLGVKSEA